MSERPTYVLTLRPEAGVVDPTRALRAALKSLLRLQGLRAIEVSEQQPAARSRFVVLAGSDKRPTRRRKAPEAGSAGRSPAAG